MNKDKPIDIRRIGQDGVNVDDAIGYLRDGEVRRAQNAVLGFDGSQRGLVNRPGLIKVNTTAADGRILGMIGVPIGALASGRRNTWGWWGGPVDLVDEEWRTWLSWPDWGDFGDVDIWSFWDWWLSPEEEVEEEREFDESPDPEVGEPAEDPRTMMLQRTAVAGWYREWHRGADAFSKLCRVSDRGVSPIEGAFAGLVLPGATTRGRGAPGFGAILNGVAYYPGAIDGSIPGADFAHIRANDGQVDRIFAFLPLGDSAVTVVDSGSEILLPESVVSQVITGPGVAWSFLGVGDELTTVAVAADGNRLRASFTGATADATSQALIRYAWADPDPAIPSGALVTAARIRVTAFRTQTGLQRDGNRVSFDALTESAGDKIGAELTFDFPDPLPISVRSLIDRGGGHRAFRISQDLFSDGIIDLDHFALEFDWEVEQVTQPTQRVLSMAAGGAYVYVSAATLYTDDEPGFGRVYRLLPEQGTVGKLGADFPSGYWPYALCWHARRLWVGTYSGTAAITQARIYSIQPDVETAWTLEHTLDVPHIDAISIASYNGELFVGTQTVNDGATDFSAIYRRSTIGEWEKTLDGWGDTGGDTVNGFRSMVVFQGALYASYYKADTPAVSAVVRYDSVNQEWETVLEGVSPHTNDAFHLWVDNDVLFAFGGDENSLRTDLDPQTFSPTMFVTETGDFGDWTDNSGSLNPSDTDQSTNGPSPFLFAMGPYGVNYGRSS